MDPAATDPSNSWESTSTIRLADGSTPDPRSSCGANLLPGTRARTAGEKDGLPGSIRVQAAYRLQSTAHANASCERVIGTIRRECLDYLIPLNARHVKRVVSEFATHYNRRRPHTALGPGLPEPSLATMPVSGHRHRMPSGYRVAKTPVLGGLHHEYRLEQDIA